MRAFVIRPSWKQGFARSAAESAHPNLWKGLAGLWVPALGPTGASLFDVSGYGNDGTLTNMDPATDWVATEKGWTLDFDGIDDQIAVTNNGKLGSSRGSLAAWVRPMFAFDTGNPFYADIISASLGGHSLTLRALTTVSNAYFGGVFRGNYGSTLTADGDTKFTSNASWQVWHHVVFTWDYGSGVNLYLNGVNDDIVAGTSNAWSGTATWTMCAGVIPWEGNIAAVSYHDRVLAPGEIQQLYVDPWAMVRRRAEVFPAAVAAAAGGTTNPFTLGAVNLLHGKLGA